LQALALPVTTYFAGASHYLGTWMQIKQKKGNKTKTTASAMDTLDHIDVTIAAGISTKKISGSWG
jgi:hypothetical protein